MKIFALLSLFALSIAHGGVPSYLSHCKNDFVLHFVELKNKTSYDGDDLYLLWDTYGKQEKWKNTGLIERIFLAHEDRHGCEMLVATSIKVQKTEYRMVVGDGHGDCDGGNYYGIVLNWSKIEKKLNGPPQEKLNLVKDIVVAGIGDGYVYCPDPRSGVDALFNSGEI